MSYFHEKIMEFIKADAAAVFLPERQPENGMKKMLVIVPDLELTGAMTVLMDLLPVFQNKGIFLYILSAGEDGKFRRKLTEQGAVVFIRPYVIVITGIFCRKHLILYFSIHPAVFIMRITL